MVTEGQLLWTPPADFAAGSHLARYQRWLRDSRGLDLPEYSALWKW
jgi:acetoacetyl-CoA synthetase